MAGGPTIVVVHAEAGLHGSSAVRRILETRSAITPAFSASFQLEVVRWSWVAPIPCHRLQQPPMLAILCFSGEPADVVETSLARLKEHWPNCPLLVVLPESAAPQIMRFLAAGASDFILMPLRPDDLLPRVWRLLRLTSPDEALAQHLRQVAASRQIIGQSPTLRAQLQKLPLIAGCNAHVLISGETGTGKELFARAVHYLGPRADKPFIAVDCGAIPAELIENEFFGHERGAYTSANRAQRGLVEEAAGGSLFLDEIESLPLAMQAKLLRFLQEKEYRSLGSSKVRRADIRIIAATNTPLEEAIRNGKFRTDLYYRLHVLSLTLPPLRDRREDIPALARHFLEIYAREYGRPASDFAEEAMQRLQSYAWPGNARELQNVVQRAVLQASAATIQPADLSLPEAPSEPVGESFRTRKARFVAGFERDYLKSLLNTHHGNVSAAARSARKDRRALWELLRKHRLLASTASPPAHPGTATRDSLEAP